MLPSKTSQRHDFGFGDAADGHGVEPYPFKARTLCCENAIQHAIQSFATRDFAECFFAQSVQADIESAQAGIFERLGLLGHQGSVGRKSDVTNAGNRGQHFDQSWQLCTNQRLTAGNAQLVDAHLGHNSHQTLDLLVREDLGSRQKANRFRHAVKTTNVAAVRDTDPQICVNAAERVD